MKPHVKTASTLVVIGSGLIMLERYGLSEMFGTGQAHIDPNLMSAMVLAPIALIVAGCAVFVIGSMRRK
jgi:hypothetical protein